MLASVIRDKIAPIVRECPRACGILSITHVEVSSDLSYVTVSVSALQKPKEAMAFLETRTRELQKAVGTLGTHRTPRLRFRLDADGASGDRIDSLLAKLSKDAPGESSKSSQ